MYARLSDEQLLVAESEQATTVPFIVKMRRAAAIVVLCICGGAAGLYLSSKRGTEQFVSIHNADMSNTLVSTLTDGSIVYLTSGATLTCPERFAADKRMVSLQGEAMFDVHGDKACPFLIETESVVVEVTGTEFDIKSADRESFELSVRQGSVKVTLKADGIPIRVEKGETVRLQADRLQKSLSADKRQFARYTEKMRFKDDRLDNIVRVINKISDKPVVFADSTLESREMTITFSNNTASEMVELLCVGLDLKYTDDGKVITIGR